MATKDQYEFFKTIYQEQNERKKTLETRAQLFLTIQTLYFGFVVLKFSDLLSSSNKSPSSLPAAYLWGQIFVAAFLAAALVFTVLAIRIRRYEAVCNLEEAAKNIGEEADDAAFFDARIADFVVASDRNIYVNSEAAHCLKIAGWSMIAAVLTHLLFLVLSLGSELNLQAKVASAFDARDRFPVIPAILDVAIVFILPPFLWWRELRTRQQ